jgi:hypothetical protein
LAQAGQGEQAAALATEATQIARGIKDPQARAGALAGVADTLAQAGRAEQAINLARGIEDPRDRAQALAIVARSAEVDGGDGVIYNAVREVLLSPYARAHLAAIPLSVAGRLLAEGRLIPK